MSVETMTEAPPVSGADPETRAQVVEGLRNFGERTHTFEAEREGPAVLLVGGTHGNEVLGVLVAEIFRRGFESGELRLVSGTMRLMLGNTRAIEINERIVPGKDDINRMMSPGILNDSSRNSWEARRARRIAREVEQSDITVDLHSTNNPAPAFVCAASSPEHREVYKWLPRIAVVTDPERLVSRGGGSIDEYADDCGKIGICYESGQALDMSNVGPVFESIKAVLIERGMLEGALPEPPGGAEYRVSGVIPHEPEYAFEFAAGKAESFAPVSEGEIIGYRAGEPVVSVSDGIILFPKKPEHRAKDGVVAFLAERVSERQNASI